ncbi:MAG: hypothetical protein OXF79_00665 [Chloroflexi bacterium]|nr:hypothetical protein [Chloroflexota bacterium]
MAGARKPRGIDDDTRRLLVRLARTPRARRLGKPPKRPSRWNPFTVPNPETAFGIHFTHASAWQFIADRLEQGEHVETIEMGRPVGATGYVMKLQLKEGSHRLYVKLELTGSKVIGRSFHLAHPADQRAQRSEGTDP